MCKGLRYIYVLKKRLYLKAKFVIQLIWFEQPLGTFLILSFTDKLMTLQSTDKHYQPQQRFVWRLRNKVQYLQTYTLQKFGNHLLMTFITFLKQKLVPSHQQSWKKMEEENNRELAFFHTLLKSNNGKISVLVYSKPMHTNPYLHYSSHHQTCLKESVVSFMFNRAYSIILNKDDLTRENTRVKPEKC